ncbi:YoaK family protein [Homoserinibacter sp. GY 40078]|uniref:YoaK family protein n=1 Tax=Homoserinibacter sp. GY 40078 TaxID=2603275 RepID=UPI0011C825B1|nr:YoaK family protein [Homoserinibacter sp. GY 40078]TXK19166.1 DUF1275 domain-containing protein [Homoserinibacter sp. GY 40078]
MDHTLRPRLSVTALLLFTASTGAIDAVSYLGLDRVFTGNMTGNVLFLGFALVGVPGIPFLNNAVALLGFVAGSIVSGRIVGRGHRPGSLPTGSIVVLVIGAVIIAAVVLVSLLSPSLPDPALLAVTAGLAFAMGGQVTAVKPVGNSDITTIVVTNTIANLARDSRLGGGHGQQWMQRLLAVVAMGAGAALGAYAILSASTVVALSVACVLYAAACTLMIVATRRQPPSTP